MELLHAIGALIIGFLLVVFTIPSIIKIARAKKLFEDFDDRKIHTQLVPPLGGVAIFIGFILSTVITSYDLSFDSLKFIFAGVVLMLFIGLKDDLMNISARTKLIVELFACFIIIVLGDVRISNFQGILGIYEIGYFESIGITILAIVTIINAFNLVDGVDGLASGLGMLAALVFGIWFFITGYYPFSTIAFALVGSMFGFFLYNVFGNSKKLFMGDTGSLIIGFVLSILVIKFNELSYLKATSRSIASAPMVSFAIIFVPLIDTIRVMTIRISQKRSPFSPDKNHLHHTLLKLFNNHLKVTLTLVFSNIVVIVFALVLNKMDININLQFLMMFLFGLGLSFIPSMFLKNKAQVQKASVSEVKHLKIVTPESVLKNSFIKNRKKSPSLVINHFSAVRTKVKDKIEISSMDPNTSGLKSANRISV
jgi:UDP-N-acetylmuramyl pentapeptide phosphotransferase/UDP-N-acetylglucosamine-1-phosphate transferase